MNNQVSEEWLKKQKEIYRNKVKLDDFKTKLAEKRTKAKEKVKFELASRYGCNNYKELMHVINDNACRYSREKILKLKEFKRSYDPVDNEKYRNKYTFAKSINYGKMRDMIYNLDCTIKYMDLLSASEDTMKALADVYEINILYWNFFDLNYYFGLEIADYKGYNFTEDERQLLNLYDSLYDTYLEYYQKFVDTLPESELKQDLEAIPNELAKIENKELVDKKLLRRSKNK